MARTRQPTIKDILRWLERGLGQGEGELYKPFFHVRDVPSTGRSTMIQGLKENRIHHYLSDIELGFHILAEFDKEVIGIREQYALLPWEQPITIANTLEIRYPRYPGTRTPVLMTSDLVLSVRRPTYEGLEVISAKASSAVGVRDEEDEYIGPTKSNNSQDKKIIRTLEKLLIEKSFWVLEEVPWTLKTELDLPKNKVSNLLFLRSSLVSRELDYLNKHLTVFPHLFYQVWERDLPLNGILNALAKLLNLSSAECFVLFGRAVWRHLLEIDLDSEEIYHQRPIRLLPETIEERACA